MRSNSFRKKHKKELAPSRLLDYSLRMPTTKRPIFTSTPTTPFSTETPVGSLTNFGIFTGFKDGFAYFLKDGREGWAGSKTFHFIQVLG